MTDSAAQHEQHAAALEQQATALQAQLQQLDTQVGILTEQYAHISADYKTLADLLAQAGTGCSSASSTRGIPARAARW